MLTALTLICNPAGADRLTRARADAEAYARRFGILRSRRILAEGEAEDFVVETQSDLATLRSGGASIAGRYRIDVVVQPLEGRKKRLLVADMDSTIIGQECLDELADLAGKKAQISAITERAMRGEIEFEGALVERLAMLKGLPQSALEETFRSRISLNPGARTLVATMKTFGAGAALVSGGFSFFTSRIADAAGFDFHDANVLGIENGALNGDVMRPIKGRAAKEEALQRYAALLGVALSETIAVGDGANDLAMLKRSGLGVAFHAKPAVAAAAHARIDHGDLTALLYLQGFSKVEFVS